MKFVGMALIIAAATALGAASSFNLKKRVLVAESFISMAEIAFIEMRYSLPKRNEIFEMIEKSECVKYIKIVSECGRKSFDFSELQKDEKEILLQFDSTLGTTDLEGQVSFLEYFKSKAVRLRDEKEEKFKKFSKLYIAMGALGGCAASLMLL